MMKGNYRVENLRPGDIDSVVSIVRNSFESNYLIPSIYRGDGIARFIQNELNNPFSAYRYFALFEGENLAGYAEFKTFHDTSTAFLNIIAVNNQFKNRGVGNKLYIYARNLFKNEGFKSIALDVYESNKIALNWYKGFGFNVVSSNTLYEVKLNLLAGKTYAISILNYPQYKVLQEKFGFYFLDISVGMMALRMGTIANDGILRTKYSDYFNHYLSKLKQSLNLNKIYYIGKSEHADLQPIDNIIRMELNINYDN